MYRIMIVDDERNILTSLRRSINATAAFNRMFVETFDNPLHALHRGEEQAFDLVVSDYRMPQMDGVSFLSKLSELQPNIARLILSGYADLNAIIGAINKAQIFRFIAKPWDDYDLISSIQAALEQRALRLENQRLADIVRVQQGKLSRSELELARLEQRFPGITKVKRNSDGSIDLDLHLEDELAELALD